MLAELGQQDQLVTRLEKIHAADPDNIPLAYFLAQQYGKAGQFDRAEPTYRDLIERHKERPPLEAYQGLVDIYRQQKDTAKLLSTLGDAVGRAVLPVPLGDAGKALLADAALTKAVVAEAQQQLAANPAQVGYGSRLGAALLAVSLKDYELANSLFELSLQAENAKPPEVMVTWGLELFMANQYAKAIEVFERGLQEKHLPAENPTFHFYLAVRSRWTAAPTWPSRLPAGPRRFKKTHPVSKAVSPGSSITPNGSTRPAKVISICSSSLTRITNRVRFAR